MLGERRRLLLVGVILSLSTGVALSGCTSAPKPLTQTLVCGNNALTTPSDIQALFNRFHNAAWSGADGADGVALPDGRTLLTFGDTLQDPHGLSPNGSRPAGYRFRHNSMMLLGSRCLGALMPPDNSEPFPNNSDGTYYWPGQPAVQRRPGNPAGDRILIPALRVRTVDPGKTFGFSTVGTDLFVFDLVPGRTPIYEAKYPMPSSITTQGITFGSGAYINDGAWLYLFGGRHDSNGTFASDIYLARVPLAHLDTPALYQYFTGRLGSVDQWSSSASSAAALATPDASGSGPSGGADVVPVIGGVGWIGNSDEFAGPGIQAWTSPSLTQTPYSRSGTLQSAVSTSEYYVYGGAAHPEHTLADGNLLVIWSRNPRSGAELLGNGNAYMPQAGEIGRVTAVAPTPPPALPSQRATPRLRVPPQPPVRGLVRLASH